MFNVGDITTLMNLLPSAARTATVTGSAVDIQLMSGRCAVILDSAAGTGTTPTLDVVIQDSDDGSTGWATVSTFAQVTNAAAVQTKNSLDSNGTKRYVRAVGTITGTSPSFAFSVNLLGARQYS